MKFKTILILVGIVVVVGGLGVMFPQAKNTIIDKTVGSVASPDIMSPYFSFGGVRQWAGRDNVASTGSTTCAILSPAATSTLIAASANFTRLASSTLVEIGVSSSAYATTTRISNSSTIMSTAGGAIVASSTAGSLIIPPYQYVTTKIGAGDTAGTVTPQGTCTAIFAEVL